MSEYSIEACLDRLCEKVSFLEKENKRLTTELNTLKQNQPTEKQLIKTQLIDIELIKSEIIESLNKKLKTDMILLSNKIDSICQENNHLKIDQKMFNEKILDQISSVYKAYDKINLDNEMIKSDLSYTKTLSQVSYNKLGENGFFQNKLSNTNPYDSDDNSNSDNLESETYTNK